MAKGKYDEWLTDDGLLLLRGWARNGLTDEQIAHNMDIATATLYAWKNKYSEIAEALKKGKEPVDLEVENALLKRALGYEYEEIKEEYEAGKPTKRTVTKKFIPPDTTAQIYWLNNRKPESWRNRREMQVTGNLGAEQSKLDDLIKQMRGDGGER